jgi:hypothetical protein
MVTTYRSGNPIFVMRVKPMWVRNPPIPLNFVLEAQPSPTTIPPWALLRPGTEHARARP